ncbi:HTH-type transcriptional regulator CynR [Tsuneonella dongtanensis]|uniref:HTH-type transcriptional regulator CynR n=1 Tax=Tsuneonella dongtanensis TaxID=692370 RepID=A0A1B2A9C4_9SPHN|nr:LysR family transcriptional regulator [Tsuneonella dongtanensis]ANY18655.1 HTH-type transcriptional regulator CynR [Tsuneonella dongtanensis]
MKIRDLETFALVANLGSISRAASELNSSQPAVSRIVGAVEHYFGAPLLHRTGRGVATTQAGKTALRAIEDSLTQLAESREAVRASSRYTSGRVTLGITPMVGQTIVARTIELMRHNHRQVDLRVLEGNGPAIISWLAKGTVDLALTYIPPAQIGDHELAEVLLEERLCLVSSKPFECAAVPFSEACSRSLVLPGRSSGMRRHLDKLASAQSLTLTPAHQVDSFPTCMGLVIEGAALTIAPEAAVSSLVRAGAVHMALIDSPEIHARLSIHRSPRKPLTRAGRALIETLKLARSEPESPGSLPCATMGGSWSA